MDRKQVEGYIFISLFILPTLVFIFTPAHPEGDIGYRIDDFFNQYLFGNGWYIPSNYPFAAKVTNNLSVILAVVAGLFIGIWRRNDIITPQPTNFWWPLLATWGLGILMLVMSIYPQEFSSSGGRRVFVFTEAFHKNPVCFMGLMCAKAIGIYMFPRTISLVLYLLGRKNKSS